jgi:hypothetical protein
MKLKEIFEAIKKVAKPEKQIRAIDIEDPMATIKHKTKVRYIGMRVMPRHNNRKSTNGRRVQYVVVNGISKPIYHFAY